jgi:hypothetical protein
MSTIMLQGWSLDWFTQWQDEQESTEAGSS